MIKAKTNLGNIASGRRKKFLPLVLVIFIVIIYVVVTLSLPAPKISAETVNLNPSSSSTAKIVWPARGQVAFGAQGMGLLATQGEQKAAPIASIAKTILALAILKEKPLTTGQTGPEITITQNDIEFYKNHLAQNGSVLPIKLGDKLNEYQMLQGLMIPSGNNIADSLATWGFGSISSYLNYANQMVKDWGLTQTTLADASGLSPQTVSSASDLVLIGEKAMDEPVLKEIVGQSQVTLPTAGAVKNYNTLLGIENIIGIKTGNSDQAGGCFLFAAQNNFSGKNIVIIGAILGATTRNDALQESLSFLQTNVRNFALINVVRAGQTVGSYNLPWGKKVDVAAAKDLDILVFNGEKVTTQANFDKIQGNKKKGDKIGTIEAKIGGQTVTVDAILGDKISSPPFWWRLLHP